MIKVGVFAEFVHFFTTFSDHNPRAGCVNGDCNFAEGPLDHNLGDTSSGDTSVQIRADLLVFNKLFGKIFPTVPVGFPTLYDAKPHADWMRLLSQSLILLDYSSIVTMRSRTSVTWQ